MKCRFEFATPNRVIFEAGACRKAGSVAREFGRRALVVVGRNPGRVGPLLQSLEAAGVSSVLYSVPGEPEIATVDRGVAQARSHECDLVVGFGGGSALDAGKAIAAMLANPGEVLDYLEVVGRGRALTQPSVPCIAIPTTAGTGTEVTRNAVLASPEHRVKASLRSPLMIPRVALVDPELTYQLPPALTAATGMDALTQLIEPYVSARANPLTDGLCLEGIRRAAHALPLAFREGHNQAARQDMAVASLFGGMALANAGLGAAHGFAGPIGGAFNAPHGAVCAALLPQVMIVNVRALSQRQPASEALGRYQTVARLLTRNERALPADAAAQIQQLVTELQIPRLSTYGIGPEHVSDLVEKSAQASSMKANPIALTRDELTEILTQSL
jgi:alcohol dehydrogenase class IV